MKATFNLTVDIPDTAEPENLQHWADVLELSLHILTKMSSTSYKTILRTATITPAEPSKPYFFTLPEELQEELIEWCQEGIRDSFRGDDHSLAALILATYDKESIQEEIKAMRDFEAEVNSAQESERE